MNLSLDEIAARLAGLEETLIYKLLDRAQFAANGGAYLPSRSGFVPQEASSLFELRLYHQEKLDAKFGRYLIPEERPFYLGLPQPRRKPPQGEWPFPIQDLETVNVTGPIRAGYHALLPRLCREGDDGQWGSSVEHDVICLQALARRIHFGALYVGESKFEESPDKFRKLVEADDEEGILEAITRSEVEARVLARVRSKVEAVQSVSDPSLRLIVDPEVFVGVFRDVLIPLTKEGEIRYLSQRVNLQHTSS
jgi:chorismate mutase